MTRLPKRSPREIAENAALARRSRQLKMLEQHVERRAAKIEREFRERMSAAEQLPHR